MLILMVGTVLYKYFVYGPMQQEGDNMYMANCRESWWTNLLYINNYAKLDKGVNNLIHFNVLFLLTQIFK